MGTTTDKLNKLLNTKEEIKAAIKEKGQPVSDEEAFASYPEKIRNIKTGSDVSSVTAEAEDVLAGKKIINSSGEIVTGTMTNQGSKTATLNAGGSYSIPKGYHDGTGKVTAKDLASQTDGDAVAGDITKGKIAWVDGVKVTGTLAAIPVLSGSSEPSSSLGEDGTIYLVMEG